MQRGGARVRRRSRSLSRPAPKRRIAPTWQSPPSSGQHCSPRTARSFRGPPCIRLFGVRSSLPCPTNLAPGDGAMRTLELTGGEIDMCTEVADRVKDIPASSLKLEAMLLLLGHGDIWEGEYIGRSALDVLRQVANRPATPEFTRLRTRLLALGFHEAADEGDATGG